MSQDGFSDRAPQPAQPLPQHKLWWLFFFKPEAQPSLAPSTPNAARIVGEGAWGVWGGRKAGLHYMRMPKL